MNWVRFVCSVSVILVGGLLQSSHANELDRSDIMCGVRCLYLSLLTVGIDPGSYADFVESCGTPDPRGFSLGQLQKAAEKYGAHTLAVRTTLDNLELRDQPLACIAHLNGHHFVNLGAIEGTQVWVVDPSGEAQVARGTFQKQWDGNALLVSRNELVPEEDLRSWGKVTWSVVTLGTLAGLGVWGVMKRRSDS